MGWWARQRERAVAAEEARRREKEARKSAPPTRAQELRSYVKEHKQEIIARCGPVYLFPDRLVVVQKPSELLMATSALEPAEAPLSGVHASVESTGSLSARGTLTRAVTVGDGWQKKTDTRMSYLTIEGPDFQWVIDLPDASTVSDPRKFAALVNTTSRKLGT